MQQPRTVPSRTLSAANAAQTTIEPLEQDRQQRAQEQGNGKARCGEQLGTWRAWHRRRRGHGHDPRVGLGDILLIARLIEALQQLLIEGAVGQSHALQLGELDAGRAILRVAVLKAAQGALDRCHPGRRHADVVLQGAGHPLNLVADRRCHLGLLVTELEHARNARHTCPQLGLRFRCVERRPVSGWERRSHRPPIRERCS